MKLILASGSKYRASLLNKFDIDFEQLSPNIDEESYKEKILDPKQLAIELAYQKSKAVFEISEDSLCIGSDQVACLGTEILGKPGSKDNAVEQLKKLNGKKHLLITAVCLLSKEHRIEFCDVTELTMHELQESQIRRYVDLDNPIDCAGSYKLEEYGISLFEEIKTNDHTAITGLPLIELSKHLMNCGFNILSR